MANSNARRNIFYSPLEKQASSCRVAAMFRTIENHQKWSIASLTGFFCSHPLMREASGRE
jgi:hypothetical protein